ncbi:MAG: hypothetical protein KGQ32_12010, partial [Xanthomonadaceae bacterium]|nr:hypothetical protein [Xanthomonadaceae bacterium]
GLVEIAYLDHRIGGRVTRRGIGLHSCDHKMNRWVVYLWSVPRHNPYDGSSHGLYVEGSAATHV